MPKLPKGFSGWKYIEVGMEPKEFLEYCRKYFIRQSKGVLGIIHRCKCHGWHTLTIQRQSKFIKRHHFESLESFLQTPSSWVQGKNFNVEFMFIVLHRNVVMGIDGYHRAFDAFSKGVPNLTVRIYNR